MLSKNGFLLIELLIGFTISIFFILILTHYIIEVKNKQQESLKKVESLSFARNSIEKMGLSKLLDSKKIVDNKKYSVKIEKIALPFSQKIPLNMKKIIISPQSGSKSWSTTIYIHTSGEDDND